MNQRGAILSGMATVLLGCQPLRGTGSDASSAGPEAGQGIETRPVARIVVEPGTTRKIGGVAEVDRKRYFCLADQGTDFDQRMPPEIYDYLLHDLGASFGRSLGPVQYTARSLGEDPQRPGFADVAPLAEKTLRAPGERFLKECGPNLDVASHGNHNEYPEYMGRHFKGTAGEGEHAEWLPENIEAAAELAANVIRYNYTDFDRPRYFEPLNEPHWEYFSDPHLAEWHLKTMEQVHALTPEVKVGGHCMSVSYFFRGNYHNFKGMSNFLDLTGGKMDFYSFHSYDYFDWEDGDFRGRVQSGLPLEGTLDLLENYAVDRLGREVDIVVSEQGGYINVKPKGEYDGELLAAELARKHFPEPTWGNELKKRSIVCFVHVSSIIANTMVFIDHPHVVQKAVPFLLPNTWGWDPKYYAGLYVPQDYTNRSVWVETHMMDFYKLFRGVGGRRVKALCSDPDLQVRAFVDGARLYLAINNQGWGPETVALRGIDAGQIEIRRFGRHADFSAYYTESTGALPEVLEVAGREAVVLVAECGKPIMEERSVNEVVCYGDKVIVPAKDATFKIKVPVDRGIDYAVLRVGLTRDAGLGHDVAVALNGKPLKVPLEDCADRLEKSEYGTTKLVPIEPADLQAENVVTVTFPDGGAGFVGTAVIRAAMME